MTSPLRIAVAGLGTVGAGTLTLLHTHAAAIAEKCGRPIQVIAVSARDKSRDRGVDLSGMTWFDDAVEMARAADADVVVELVGGEDGPAKAICEAAISAGRSVVTANKALLAVHGTDLARDAEAAGLAIGYEAAVAGGIPIVKAMREGLAANTITRIYGILNGTCNYILTEMRLTGRAFDDVLAEAQSLGYAEAEPSVDVDGIDAAHKLAILASLAFGAQVDFDGVYVEGVRAVAPLDIEFADTLGYRIKLLGSARLTADGLEQRVHPCMIDKDSAIAHVEGVFNAVVVVGDFVDDTMFEGKGAGAGPTASAVVADLMDLAAGRRAPTFAVPAERLVKLDRASMERHRGAYYIRLAVADRPGVIAGVTAAFRDQQVSIESMIQQGRSETEAVPVVLTVHETTEASMRSALEIIGHMDEVVEAPHMIRIEPL
ncbi:MAG: homoserine dehydrogenase [Alphaproteobacteria bacterium]|nr:homoserine dehydrogenase [Alphaproteobacteria bacterium]